MTQLEVAMTILMKTFDEYAAMEGNKATMNKTETKTLQITNKGLSKNLQKTEAKNQAEVDKMLKSLDFNGDCEVDFSEFVVLVSALTCACHDRCPQKS
ncbi:Protein S100-P [Liparis tanakae]|uniref:Protein S100-P n=1 Tax=Liparis tanakae TaxID=230148 RepID=A0A4Z2FIN8_9TELE|nr:Protein S100-P [Liparis tanakae]